MAPSTAILKGAQMPVTQTDIDNLNAAIRNEERLVKLNGKTVEYRSIAELIAARDDALKQFQIENPKPRPRHTRLYQNGRGY